MNRPSTLTIILVSLLIFGGWELADHLLLMQLGMFARHALALLVEASIAALAVCAVVQSYEQARTAQRRSEQFVAVIAAAMVSDAGASSPLEGLRRALKDLRDQPEATPDTLEAVSRAEAELQRVARINKQLAATLPEVTG